MATWSILVPARGENLITNPSAERGTADWTAYDSTITRVLGEAAIGYASIRIDPSSNNGAGAAVAAYPRTLNYHWMSAFVKGGSGVTFQLGLTVNNSTMMLKMWTANGSWQRITGLSFLFGTANVAVRLYKAGSSTAPVWIDGVQLEDAGATTRMSPSTYIDGDQPGCAWGNIPHASTSIRSVTAPGGIALELTQDNALAVTLQTETGLPPTINHVLPSAGQTGAAFDRNAILPRQLTLTIHALGTTTAHLHQLRRQLVEAIAPRIGREGPQIRLQYEHEHDRFWLDAVYDSGLEWTGATLFDDVIALRVIAYDPFWQAERQASGTIGVRDWLPGADYALAQDRDVAGWQARSGLDAPVYALMERRGLLYAGGTFTGYTRTWNESSWTTINALNGPAHAFAVGEGGTVYVGGAFTVPGTGIAQLRGNSWASLGNLPAGITRALTIAPGGTLVAGGDYGVRQWLGNTWGTIGPDAPAGTVYALVTGLDQRVYAGGAFTSPGNNLAFWNGGSGTAPVWGTALSGVDGTVYSLAVGRSGGLYVGGRFDTAGGGSALNIAMWDGAQFRGLGDGIGGTILTLSGHPDGGLYVGGDLVPQTYAELTNAGAWWYGASWRPLDGSLPGDAQVRAAVIREDGRITLGYNTSGTAMVAARADWNNPSLRENYPVIEFWGSGYLNSLVNETTGDTLVLGYEFNEGERVRLSLVPGQRGLKSSYRGDITRTLQHLSRWRLAPGVNRIRMSVFSGTIAAAAFWNIDHWTLDEIGDG